MASLIFFIAWTGILILSLLGISYGVDPEFTQLTVPQIFYSRWVVLGVSTIYMIILILKIKSKFKKEKDYEVSVDGGRIIVSSQSIKSVVEKILKEEEGIVLQKVITKKQSSGFNIKIEIESEKDNNFYNRSVEIQKRIKKEIKDILNVEISHIDVKLLKIKR